MADPCWQFYSNPSINPLTARSIIIGGPTYRNLVEKCGYPSQVTSSPTIEYLPGVGSSPSGYLPGITLPTVNLSQASPHQLNTNINSIVMPTQNQGSPQHTVISSQEVQNGCVTSYTGRSGEDRYVTALLNGNIKMLAVFDGHGGYSVANYLRDNLPNKLAQVLLNINFNDQVAISQAITSACIEIDKEMFDQGLESGSTAIIALYSDSLLYLINIGDSRAVVFNQQGQVIVETRDFKPKEEETRIILAGGNVTRFSGIGLWRVNGSLAVSRAFGDFNLKYSLIGGIIQPDQYGLPSNIDYNTYNPQGPVSVIPDIYRHVIGPNQYILLASDGLFDAFSSQEAVNFVINSINVPTICQQIINDARNRTTDDITVMIIRLS